MVRLGIHAGLPGVAGHPRQGEEEQGQAAQEEEHEGSACAGEGPGVIVLDPDGVLTVDHALHRLPQDLHRDEDAEACGEERRAQGSAPAASARGTVETQPRGEETVCRPRG